MGQVASSPEAQRLQPGQEIQYQGQTYSVARDDITRRKQFVNVNTGQIHNPYSIYDTQSKPQNTVEYLSRRCQNCGGRGHCNC